MFDWFKGCLNGRPFEVGNRVKTKDGRIVEIVDGEYLNEHGLRNHWYFRAILSDGSMGELEDCHGWWLEDRLIMDIDHLKYRLLKLRIKWLLNTSRDEYDSFEFFGFHVIPASRVKHESILMVKQTLKTDAVWRLGNYFLVISSTQSDRSR